MRFLIHTADMVIADRINFRGRLIALFSKRDSGRHLLLDAVEDGDLTIFPYKTSTAPVLSSPHGPGRPAMASGNADSATGRPALSLRVTWCELVSLYF